MIDDPSTIDFTDSLLFPLIDLEDKDELILFFVYSYLFLAIAFILNSP